MKQCHTCKVPKSLKEFGNNKKNKDGKQPYCKACSRLKDKRHYENSDSRKKAIRKSSDEAKERNMLYVLNYLRSHSCVDCGEDDPIVLDFDHQDDKRDNVSCMIYLSIETVQREIAKCEVRCANCHRRKTAKEFGYFRYRLAAIG